MTLARQRFKHCASAVPNKIQKLHHSRTPIKRPLIKRGTLRFAVLEIFSCSFSVILISMRYCSFLQTYGMQFFSILDSIRNYPWSPPMFSEPFPVSDWTFPMKLSSHGNRKLQFLVLQLEKGKVFPLIISQHANGCYLFWLCCLNRK